MKIGTTTIPMAGWVVDYLQPAKSREQRLDVIRKLVVDYGLSAVELTLDLGIVYPQVFDASFYADISKLQDELGFACSVHLPFLWLDLSSLNESIRKASVESLRKAIELTQPLEITDYVLHLWGFTTIQIAALLENQSQKQSILSVVWAQAERSLGELSQFLDPRKLCVENLESPPFDLVLPLIEKHGYSICLDVGHLAYQGGGELDFLDHHHARIGAVHLHDAVLETRTGPPQVSDHLALGSGQIDYQKFMDKLEQVGYDGIVVLELNTKADLEESIQRVKPYI
jgi:sugar phosphate isomerase/epimerase